MTQFEREILEQPACLARLLREGRGAAETIAEAVQRFAPAFIVTAARGSSDNAARYAKYLFGAHNRLVVSLGAPSLITLYGAAPSLQRALVIGISQSGQSPDIVALLDEGRRQGALTIALTNQARSPLADVAAHAFDLRAGPEQAVVASKSYTCQLLALAMLSAAMEGEGNENRWRDLEALPEAARKTLAINGTDHLTTAISSLAGAARMIVIGRGFNFGTAFEIALKIKETAYVMAEPYATPDLFHGPLAMVEPGFPALVIAPNGPTLTSTTAALDALHARGAHVLTISDSEAVLARPGIHMPLPFAPGVPEWLSPIVAALPGQLCALRLAQARNLDPDQPRGLSKVTRTR
ncbi:MAG: SIS domain-containing protein [Deltaproteobacteria bacterium]|nr:SIS domain-containing protein [Deltaproteobacteria bacterium]